MKLSALSCTEGEEDGSPSSRARALGARVGGSGDHPWGNRNGIRARSAVWNLRKKGSQDTPRRGGAVGTGWRPKGL